MGSADPINAAGWLTVAQAARRWGLSRERVYVWRREGRVPSVWSDTVGCWLIPADAQRPEPIKPPPGPGRPRQQKETQT